MPNRIKNLLQDCLDSYSKQIIKTSALVNDTGLLTGKTGIALFLYHLARYKNDEVIHEYANNLVDIILQEINADAGTSFNCGLSGIAWGFIHLFEQDFLESGDDLFVEIDAKLFKEEEDVLDLNNFDIESGKGLYLLKRIKSDKNRDSRLRGNDVVQGQGDFIRSYMIDYLKKMYLLMTLRYTNYAFTAFRCKDMIRVIHICDQLLEDEFFKPDLEPLCRQIKEIIDNVFLLEMSDADKYFLQEALRHSSWLSEHININNQFSTATLTGINSFYLNRMILSKEIRTPEFIHNSLFSIIEDKKRTDELLSLLSPQNAGLGNYVTGLAWSILQWFIENDINL